MSMKAALQLFINLFKSLHRKIELPAKNIVNHTFLFYFHMKPILSDHTFVVLERVCVGSRV